MAQIIVLFWQARMDFPLPTPATRFSKHHPYHKITVGDLGTILLQTFPLRSALFQ